MASTDQSAPPAAGTGNAAPSANGAVPHGPTPPAPHGPGHHAATPGPTPHTAPGPAGTEVEWQFDALDLRPVERWLAGLPSTPAASVPAPGTGTEPNADSAADTNAAARETDTDTTPDTDSAPDTNHGTVTVLAKPARRLVDHYLDTEDWRIGRAGYVLRTRRRGRHDEATLKDLRPATATGLRRRIEVTETLADPATDLRTAPGPVGTRAAIMAGRRPLRQVLEVRTRRRPFSLRVAGVEVAELALDDTSISVGDRQHPVRLRRVEVEVDPAWVGRMAPVVANLSTSCGLRPANLSKFEAGLLTLGLAIPGPPDLGPTEVHPGSTLGQLAYAVLRRHIATLVAHEPGTRLGEDAEELHDMRVATRRLRAAMDLFSTALPPRAAMLRRELGWLADALGRVRDLDVQLARGSEWAQAPGDGPVHEYGAASMMDEQAMAEIRARLTARWHAARSELLAVLDSARYGRLVRGLSAMVRRGPARRGPLGEPTALVAPDLIGECHQAAAKSARRALRSGAPSDYHQLRIRCKRLRYALECTAELYPGKTDRFVKRLVRLQDHLGLMQDAEVAMRNLRELAVGSLELSPSTIFPMGAVAERYRAEAAALLATMPKRLGVLRGREWQALADAMEARRSTIRDERAAVQPVAAADGLGLTTPGARALCPPSPQPARR